MPSQFSQIFTRALLIVVWIALLVNARPSSHFGEVNQAASDQDNLLDSGLKQWQLEMLAQRLSEMNGQPPNGAVYDNIAAGWERGIRSPENKRQSRYRQCYFNPISCFRK